MVARNSPRALAAAVVGLFGDHDRLRAMRRRAAQFAREDWTVDDMVDATVEVYRSVLHRSNCAAGTDPALIARPGPARCAPCGR